MEFPRYARCQVSWKIQNLTALNLGNPRFHTVDTQMFTINLKNNQWGYSTTKWKLVASKNRSTLSLYLKTADKYGKEATYSNYQNLSVKYEMKIKDTYSEYQKVQKGVLDGIWYEHRMGKIISVADLNKRTSWRIVRDKTIEVVVNLDIIERKSENAPKISPVSMLSTSFESMFGNDKYSDYTLVTADGEEIPVHKNVLASRSKVFEAMMETQLKEGSEKKALIDDIESKSLKEFLRFVYCGRVNEIEAVAVDLIYAAEKYGLSDLKPLCVQSLVRTISIDTAVETFILADLHQEKSLKKYALDYILWNYAEMKDHESWTKLSTTLYKEILDFAATADKAGNYIKVSSTITIAPPAQPAQNRQVPPAQNRQVPLAQNVANHANIVNQAIGAIREGLQRMENNVGAARVVVNPPAPNQANLVDVHLNIIDVNP